MPITTWTSDGMTWPPTGKWDIISHLEAIRLAIAERAAASGNSSSVATPAAKLTVGSICQSIQNEITQQIPLFVNHTDSSGDWDGSATAPPMWSESTIIAAIGDASRLAVPAVMETVNAWLYQQYNLLNLLRWTKKTDTFGGGLSVNSEMRDATSDYATSWAATYAAAVTAWNAASWGTASPSALGTGSKEIPGFGTSYARVQRVRSVQAISGLPAGVDCDIVWMAYMQAPDPSNLGVSVSDPGELVFDDESIGFSNNRWYAFDLTSDNTSTRQSAALGDIATAPAEPADPVGTASALGWNVLPDGHLAVLKWGFSFLA